MRYSNTIERCLQENGYVVVPITGTSMWPLLKEGESQVYLVAKEGKKLKKEDIVLYRRKDGTLILHRIMKMNDSHVCWMCGDHQWRWDEKVQEDQILAIAQGFFRKGKYIEEDVWWYRLYKRFWNGNMVIRRCCLLFLRLSGLEKRILHI